MVKSVVLDPAASFAVDRTLTQEDVDRLVWSPINENKSEIELRGFLAISKFLEQILIEYI